MGRVSTAACTPSETCALSQARTHVLPKQQRAHLGVADDKVAGGVKVEAQRAARAHIGQRLRVQVVSARRPGVGPGQPHVAKLVEQPQRAIRAHRHRLCGVGQDASWLLVTVGASPARLASCQMQGWKV